MRAFATNLPARKQENPTRHEVGRLALVHAGIQLQGHANRERPHRRLQADVQELRGDALAVLRDAAEHPQRLGQAGRLLRRLAGRLAPRVLGDQEQHEQADQDDKDVLVREQGVLEQFVAERGRTMRDAGMARRK
jgi:hypothetical protein